MENCTGTDFVDKITILGYIVEEEAKGYLKCLFEAINHCHKQNISHRDLKPDNFILTTNEDDAILKVLDFGFSKKFGNLGYDLSTIVGTSWYLAPEVLSKKYDCRCDIWSLGVCMYVFLSGFPPFPGKNDSEIYDKICKGKFTFHQKEWESVSNDAKNLIKKILKVDPNERPSIEEILDDPWFKNKTIGNEIIINEDVVNKLKN